VFIDEKLHFEMVGRFMQHPYRFAYAENGGVHPVYDSANYQIPVR
jgi:hypothetical protein